MSLGDDRMYCTSKLSVFASSVHMLKISFAAQLGIPLILFLSCRITGIEKHLFFKLHNSNKINLIFGIAKF